MSGRAGSTGLNRCTDRYKANSSGATVNARRCSADGARKPHAAKVSSRCRGDVARLQPASSGTRPRSEEHTSELQSRVDLVCRLLLEKKKNHADTLGRETRTTGIRGRRQGIRHTAWE